MHEAQGGWITCPETSPLPELEPKPDDITVFRKTSVRLVSSAFVCVSGIPFKSVNSWRPVISPSPPWWPEAPNTLLGVWLVLRKWHLGRDLEGRVSSSAGWWVSIRFWCAPLVQGWQPAHMSRHLLFIVSVRLWFVFLFHVSLVSGATANIICPGIKKSKLFINSKVSLGLESVFLKCVYIWWLYYNPTDVSADNLQIEAHLKDGQVTGPLV